MDISKNRSLDRKNTYIPYIFKDEFDETEEISIKIHDINKYLTLASNNRGMYIRPLTNHIYKNHLRVINKTIQINGSNRNLKYYPNPFNFVTYIESNHIGSVIVKEDNKDIEKEKLYTFPFIRNKLPPIRSIKLNKIIIPNNYNIIKKDINANNDFSSIKSELISLLNQNKLNLNSNHKINNNIFTVVNKIDKKINLIKNYNINFVYEFSLNNDNEITNIFEYTVLIEFINSASKQKVYNLCVKEFDDISNYSTDHSNTNTISFKLLPKSIKGKFLFANSRNIQKNFGQNSVKTKKISIKLLDNFNNDIKMNNLDYDINTPENCICCIENECKNFTCCCNYILHPLNPLYQIFIYFDFQYLDLILSDQELIV